MILFKKYNRLIHYVTPLSNSEKLLGSNKHINDNSLGLIVTDHLINVLKTSKGIIPEIVFTNQAKLAKQTLIEMIDSLSLLTAQGENNLVYNFIKTNYKLPISAQRFNQR